MITLKLKWQIIYHFLKNDPEWTERFYKWIRFLNELSNVTFTLTANTKLNVHLLRFIRQNSFKSIIDDNSGLNSMLEMSLLGILKMILMNSYIFLDMTSLIHEAMKSSCFFRGIWATLDNGETLKNFYKIVMPKEWNMFFTIISYSFSIKTGGWYKISTHI